MPGKLIVFEGIDNVGKTTQARLLFKYLLDTGTQVTFLRQPEGETPAGRLVRQLLLSQGTLAEWAVTPPAELFMHTYLHAMQYTTTIVPALTNGMTVILDRNYYSTLAYQSYGRGLPLELVSVVAMQAAQGIVPDITLLLEANELDPFGAKDHPDAMDMEEVAFRTRVRYGYAQLTSDHPDIVQVRVARGESVNHIAERIRGLVAHRLGPPPY